MKSKKNWFLVVLILLIGINFLKNKNDTINYIENTEENLNIINKSENINQWYLNGNIDNYIPKNIAAWRTDDISMSDIASINFEEFKENYNQEQNVVISVLDDGVDIEDFKNRNYWINYNELANDGIDNDNNGFVDDIVGWNFLDNNNLIDSLNNHGNEILGIMLGSDNNKKYVGMLEHTNIKVMSVKCISEKYSKNSIKNAIIYAEQNKATICCMAFSMGILDQDVYETMKKSNMLFVVSAGNNGAELGKEIICYPAMFKLNNMIVVADSRLDGKLSYCSNYSKEYVDIAVPGTDIMTIVKSEECISGTSASVAIMGAVCALIRSTYKYDVSAEELKQKVLSYSENSIDLLQYINSGRRLDLSMYRK